MTDALHDVILATNDLRREVKAVATQLDRAPWLRHLIEAAARYDEAKLRYEAERGLCPRCGLRPPDGSRVMCAECWIETGEPVK